MTTLHCFARGGDPQRHHRALRAVVGVAQVLLASLQQALSVEEAWLCVMLPALQVGGFVYFTLVAQINAPLRTRALVVPGMWEAHDNFHVIAFTVHLLQIYGVRAGDSGGGGGGGIVTEPLR